MDSPSKTMGFSRCEDDKTMIKHVNGFDLTRQKCWIHHGKRYPVGSQGFNPSPAFQDIEKLSKKQIIVSADG